MISGPWTSWLFWASLNGCAGPSVDPMTTEQGQACAKAYSATIVSLSARFARRGRPQPKVWPSESDYVDLCVGLDMTEEQLACLDPEWMEAHTDDCAAAIKPAKSQVDSLSRWFNDELKKSGGGQPSPP